LPAPQPLPHSLFGCRLCRRNRLLAAIVSSPRLSPRRVCLLAAFVSSPRLSPCCIRCLLVAFVNCVCRLLVSFVVSSLRSSSPCRVRHRLLVTFVVVSSSCLLSPCLVHCLLAAFVISLPCLSSPRRVCRLLIVFVVASQVVRNRTSTERTLKVR
jgi:hypothetical protein